jgi:alpha-N-acetylglucosamine transferase
MYAYVLYHFGGNIKYLEYELYFLANLRTYTKYDIIYGYSEDTPDNFLDKIKQLNINIKFYKIYDNTVTVNIKSKFTSVYKHFNTLRTCNFMYSYLLTDYEKICVVESDMFIIKDIDDIFNLNVPSVHYSFYNKKKFDKNHDYTSNNERSIDRNVVLKGCTHGSSINGGIMVLNPSYKMFKQCMKSLKEIIKVGCLYPNEALFLINNPIYYNLPVKYNFSHAFLESGYDKIKDIRLIHYEGSTYKLLDNVKDNYFEKIKNKKNVVNNITIFEKFYKDIYLKYNKQISNII